MKSRFELDDQTKDLIAKTGSLLGVDTKIVQEVFQYMLFSWFLSVAKEDKKFHTLPIPYLGSVGVKFHETDILNPSDSTKITPDIEPFIYLNPEFKRLLGEARNNKGDFIGSLIIDTVQKRILNEIEGN